MGAEADNPHRLLEVSVALEIMRFERDHLRAQMNILQEQVQKAQDRAERAEARLHEVTMVMADLSRQAIHAPARSLATEVMMDGKSILRLSNPVASGYPPRHG